MNLPTKKLILNFPIWVISLTVSVSIQIESAPSHKLFALQLRMNQLMYERTLAKLAATTNVKRFIESVKQLI